MKKLLLAALLAVGASAFGAEVIEMGTESGTTDTVLPIIVRGKVVKATGMQVVVTPTMSSGADGRSLEFVFGDIQQTNENRIAAQQGEFQIQVTNSGEPVKFAKAPEVKLQGGDSTSDGLVDGKHHKLEVKNVSGGKLLDLDYQYSGALSGEKLFKGKVEVTPDMTNNAATGLFTATAVNLGIKVTNQDASGSEL